MLAALAGVLMLGPAGVCAQDVQGIRPLLSTRLGDPEKFLPTNTRLLNDSVSLERFLDALDGAPPDWAAVYGHGHHDPGHDDRLFNLNRERDTKREGRPALRWRVAFVWYGELSAFDPEAGGFSVTIGPKFIPTSWGVVRFKADNLPGNLTAIPNPGLRESLRRKLEKGERIEIDVVMSGRLIPEESLVYDFSHEEEGRGLIMPVVRIERIDYLLRESPKLGAILRAAEARAALLRAGESVVAVGGAEAAGRLEPGAATNDFQQRAGRSPWIVVGRAEIVGGLVPVLHPFRSVPRHVEETVRAGAFRQAADRQRQHLALQAPLP